METRIYPIGKGLLISMDFGSFKIIMVIDDDDVVEHLIVLEKPFNTKVLDFFEVINRPSKIVELS